MWQQNTWRGIKLESKLKISILNIFLPLEFFDFLQCLFSTWLSEKEDAMNKIHTTGFKDQNEMLSSLQKMAVCIS